MIVNYSILFNDKYSGAGTEVFKFTEHSGAHTQKKLRPSLTNQLLLFPFEHDSDFAVHTLFFTSTRKRKRN